MRRLLALAFCALLAGCVSVSENVASLGEVGGDAVLVIGKIEIVPRVKPEEQKYRAGVDVFDTKRHFIGRAILFMSDKPEFQERTDTALNPPLEEVFFLKLPANRRFVAKGSVTMELIARAVSARQSTLDRAEILFPGPLEIDLQPGDRAVYIGTLRLHRDEFHEVTKVELLDQYNAAATEYQRRFPGTLPPRKALLRRAKRAG